MRKTYQFPVIFQIYYFQIFYNQDLHGFTQTTGVQNLEDEILRDFVNNLLRYGACTGICPSDGLHFSIQGELRTGRVGCVPRFNLTTRR